MKEARNNGNSDAKEILVCCCGALPTRLDWPEGQISKAKNNRKAACDFNINVLEGRGCKLPAAQLLCLLGDLQRVLLCPCKMLHRCDQNVLVKTRSVPILLDNGLLGHFCMVMYGDVG